MAGGLVLHYGFTLWNSDSRSPDCAALVSAMSLCFVTSGERQSIDASDAGSFREKVFQLD